MATCPCGNQHPDPTLDERSELDAHLYDAIQAIDKAWGVANRTPSLHDFTESIGAAMVEIQRIKQTV